MSKLAGKAKDSKLKKIPIKRKEKLLRQTKHKEFPRSYRFDAEVMNILAETKDRVNEVSPKKTTEARLVKTLIYLSRDLDPELIIKYLKEAW